MKSTKIEFKIEQLKNTPLVEQFMTQIYEQLTNEIERLKNLGKRKATIKIMIK